jgi:bifunctional non-homologous end joining protein LigD
VTMTGWLETEFNGRLPQPRTLVSIVDPANTLASDDMAVSQKLDGRRLLLVRTSDGVIGVSRAGTETQIPNHIITAFSRVRDGWIFDGEYVDDTYHVFDLLRMPDNPLHTHAWKYRQEALQTVLDNFDPQVKVVNQVYGFLKQDFVDALEKGNAEGYVMSHINGIYRYGVRSNAIGKYKFVKDVDCVILHMGEGGSDNLVLGVYDDSDGKLVEIGKVSALTGDGKKHTFSIGEVVSVSYLYVTKDLRLYQPVKPKLRLDKTAEQCKLDQVLPFVTSKDVLKPTY